MQDRFRDGENVIGKKARRAVAIARVAMIGFTPLAAIGAVKVVNASEQPTEIFQEPDLGEDLEHESLRIALPNIPSTYQSGVRSDCEVQTFVTFRRFRPNSLRTIRSDGSDGVPNYHAPSEGQPGDILLGSLQGWNFSLSAFDAPSVLVRGKSSNKPDGRVEFNTNNRADAGLLSFKGRSGPDGRIPLTLTGEKRYSRNLRVPCGFLQRLNLYIPESIKRSGLESGWGLIGHSKAS